MSLTNLLLQSILVIKFRSHDSKRNILKIDVHPWRWDQILRIYGINFEFTQKLRLIYCNNFEFIVSMLLLMSGSLDPTLVRISRTFCSFRTCSNSRPNPRPTDSKICRSMMKTANLLTNSSECHCSSQKYKIVNRIHYGIMKPRGQTTVPIIVQ